MNEIAAEVKAELANGIVVLNETAGGMSDGLVVFGVLLGLFGLALLIGGFIENVEGAVVCGFGALLITALIFALGPQPVRYEVTLRDGAVIDATRWEIVEQRGDIYVIEEREAAE